MTILNGIRLIAAFGSPVAAFCQPAGIAPVPNDPAEIVTGPVQPAGTFQSREAALDLLARARTNYDLRGGGRGYDLKISFTATSNGQTRHDGVWEMEEIYQPQQGLRWTAKGSGGYATTQIQANKMFYADGTANTIPLRLHQARSTLFGPIATPEYTDRDIIRTSQATFDGAALTCILLSGAGNPLVAGTGRRWEESEDCIDPQSGLLRIHSLAPGYYQIYDYSNAVTLGDRKLAGKVTVTEGGRTVMQLQVESLAELATADPALFVPTEAMKAKPQGVRMAQARKFWVFAKRGPVPAGSVIHPLCVFGLITPSGQFTEAHSLQPSDPNSQTAIDIAEKMKFNIPPEGERPEQHFGFVFVRFVSSQ